jgi:hypothetical protein
MDYSAIILDGYLCCGNLQKEAVSKRNVMHKVNGKSAQKTAVKFRKVLVSTTRK